MMATWVVWWGDLFEYSLRATRSYAHLIMSFYIVATLKLGPPSTIDITDSHAEPTFAESNLFGVES